MTGTPPRRLRVEHLRTPLGLGVRRPRFSWWLPAGAQRQLGYRVRADNGWDTGWVQSDQSVLVEYDGPAPASAQPVTLAGEGAHRAG